MHIPHKSACGGLAIRIKYNFDAGAAIERLDNFRFSIWALTKLGVSEHLKNVILVSRRGKISNKNAINWFGIGRIHCVGRHRSPAENIWG